MSVTPRFYFNADENLCASEHWVIQYLHIQNPNIDEDEIEGELHSCREYFGWYECQVSDDIFDEFC